MHIDALCNEVKDVTVFMKRSPADFCINNYKPHVLRAWEANMDSQFVENPYAICMYSVCRSLYHKMNEKNEHFCKLLVKKLLSRV